jgi:hypothetical protein
MSSVYVKTIEFPTDIIEQEWATVKVYEHKGDYHASLIFPQERHVGEEMAIRLEDMGLKLFLEERKNANR